MVDILISDALLGLESIAWYPCRVMGKTGLAKQSQDSGIAAKIVHSLKKMTAMEECRNALRPIIGSTEFENDDFGL